MSSRYISIALASLFVYFSSKAGIPAPLPPSTPWDIPRLMSPPSFEWENTESKVKSLIYQGLAYKEASSQVFAYYASPKDFGFTEEIYPAMVLVHGGGGSAFEAWAKLWASKGYAAIAMDLAGKGADHKSLPQGGPDQGHEQKFSTIDEPLTQQWTYHAVSNVLLAHSLIRSFDEVDTERIGVTGISWGGYLTCIVAGVDDRFRFAMPVYGCGFLRENSVWKESEFGKMTQSQSNRWHQLWDPATYLASAKMPIFFLNGTNDFAYPMDSYAKSCALVQTEKNYSIQLRMKHGHIFDFPEFFVGADYYLRDGIALPYVSRPLLKKGNLNATVKTRTKLLTAQLHFTEGPHADNKDREWMTKPLSLNGTQIQGESPPNEATAYYVDVRDERDILVSSEVITR
jgi:dienelactone hydrolase